VSLAKRSVTAPSSVPPARRPSSWPVVSGAVLGNHGEVLALARTTRLFTRAQRKALRIRDQHCRAEGCHTPPPGPKPTTRTRGPEAARPTSPTRPASATSTTAPTTTTTPTNTSPTATSATDTAP